MISPRLADSDDRGLNRRSMKKTIMVIDDDVDLREAVLEALEEEGYHTIGYGNGRDALEGLRRQDRPDLILLDLMMPTMNGWQFRAEQMQDAGLATIPVVVMTASRQFDPGSIDALEYVQKPLSLETLLETVKKAAR
jgi:CheY-like chemotaxis protein